MDDNSIIFVSVFLLVFGVFGIIATAMGYQP